MAHLNSYWCHAIIFCTIFLLCIEQSTSQFNPIRCYECTNCTDPFSANGSVTISGASCYSCLKLIVSIAYAPYSYAIRKCVPACLETSQTFGGGTVIGTCCASDLCNGSSMIQFPLVSRLLILIFIITIFVKNFD